MHLCAFDCWPVGNRMHTGLHFIAHRSAFSVTPPTTFEENPLNLMKQGWRVYTRQTPVNQQVWTHEYLFQKTPVGIRWTIIRTVCNQVACGFVVRLLKFLYLCFRVHTETTWWREDCKSYCFYGAAFLCRSFRSSPIITMRKCFVCTMMRILRIRLPLPKAENGKYVWKGIWYATLI